MSETDIQSWRHKNEIYYAGTHIRSEADWRLQRAEDAMRGYYKGSLDLFGPQYIKAKKNSQGRMMYYVCTRSPNFQHNREIKWYASAAKLDKPPEPTFPNNRLVWC